MKKENVSAPFQGFQTSSLVQQNIVHASTRAGRREKRLIIANIILKILKILEILLLKILEILLPTPAVRTSSFVLQTAPAAEKNGSSSQT